MAAPVARSVMFVCAHSARAQSFATAAGRANWRVLAATSAESAIATLGTHDGLALDAVIIDHADLDALIPEIVARRPALPILVETDNTIAGVAELRAGATDYLQRPASADMLTSALDQALATSTLRELRPLSTHDNPPLGFAEIVGADTEFRRGLALAAKGASGRVPMLIEGPTGTGKALVTSAIHSASPRDKRPLVMVDIAALPESRVESELFGHEKGAFARIIGKAVLADTGTLVIKNVDHLTLALQHKLL